jgi:hypothetical protein
MPLFLGVGTGIGGPFIHVPHQLSGQVQGNGKNFAVYKYNKYLKKNCIFRLRLINNLFILGIYNA